LPQRLLDLESPVLLRLINPTRVNLVYEKPVTALGAGFFSFTLTLGEVVPLIDDTYFFEITQNGVLLKKGRCTVKKGDSVVIQVLDYTLDFILG